jgi:hypothetical protein
MKRSMKQQEMKTLLKSFKNYKSHFSVPEPDADFEHRILKSLQRSDEWKKVSVWQWLNGKLDFFRFEVTGLRFAGACAAILVVAGTLGFYSTGTPTEVAVQTPKEIKYSHPELNSMLQRGGAKALQAWVAINGDISALGSSGSVDSSNLSAEEQKRILAELEKKWAPAL